MKTRNLSLIKGKRKNRKLKNQAFCSSEIGEGTRLEIELHRGLIEGLKEAILGNELKPPKEKEWIYLQEQIKQELWWKLTLLLLLVFPRSIVLGLLNSNITKCNQNPTLLSFFFSPSFSIPVPLSHCLYR